jgi:hypothetical protein
MVVGNLISYFLIVLLFIYYFLYGFVVMRTLGKKISANLTNIELLTISFFVGIFFHIWISFIIAIISKNIIVGHIISTLIGLIYIVYNKKLLRKIKLTRFKRHTVAIMVILVLTFILFFSVFFRFDNSSIYAGPPNYGDFSLHTSLILNFAQGNNIPPMYTIYSGAKLGYPFFVFYFNALFVNLGMDVFYSYNLVQFVLTFSLMFFLYLLGLRITHKRSFSLLFCNLVYFGSGIGLIYFFESKLPFLETISNDSYAIIIGKNILPLNLAITSYSQRTGLFGWIYIFSIFLMCFNEIFNLKEWKKPKEYLIIILLLGGMFFFHSYSFLVIMLFLGFIWIWKRSKTLFIILLGSGFLALPQIIWTHNQTMQKGFIKFIDGVFVSFRKPFAFLWLWIQNFGGMLVFFTVGITKGKKYLHLLLPMIVFFILGNLIQLQPWNFDNHKMIMIVYVIMCIFGIIGLQILWEIASGWKGILMKISIIVIVFLILLPSIFGTYHHYSNKYHFANRKDQIMGEDLQKIIPPNSVILTGTQHNHPVFMFSARPIFEGYGGWTWSHGLGGRGQETRAMFESTNKTEACRLFNKHKIKYVYISDWERNEDWYKLNESFFVDNFNIIYKKGSNFLFKIDCSLN